MKIYEVETVRGEAYEVKLYEVKLYEVKLYEVQLYEVKLFGVKTNRGQLVLSFCGCSSTLWLFWIVSKEPQRDGHALPWRECKRIGLF